MDNSVADITPYVNSANNYREAIILPVALSDAYKVSFVLDGRTREWVFANLDISLPKFNAGSQYTFGIYIDPTEDIIIGRLEDVDAGNSSAPWEDGSNENGTADGNQPAAVPSLSMPIKQHDAFCRYGIEKSLSTA